MNYVYLGYLFIQVYTGASFREWMQSRAWLDFDPIIDGEDPERYWEWIPWKYVMADNLPTETILIRVEEGVREVTALPTYLNVPFNKYKKKVKKGKIILSNVTMHK